MRRRAVLSTGATLALPLVLRASPGHGQAPPSSPGPAFQRIPLGTREVFVVTDGATLRNAAGPGVVANAQPDQVVAALRSAGFPGPEFLNPYNPTVLRTPQGLVAFDVGTGGTAGPQTGQFLANMRAAGLDPAQIVAVVLTHLHGDHFGGLVDANGTPNFPNARVLVAQREWAFWTDAGEESRARDLLKPNFANARRRFAPYQAKLETFTPGTEILPGVTAQDTPGHSPGHVAFLLSDGGQQVMISGDAIHAPFFYWANPDWYISFDTDPAQAVATRKRLLDQLTADRVPVIVYHAGMPGVGRAERAGSGYRMVPLGA